MIKCLIFPTEGLSYTIFCLSGDKKEKGIHSQMHTEVCMYVDKEKAI